MLPKLRWGKCGASRRYRILSSPKRFREGMASLARETNRTADGGQLPPPKAVDKHFYRGRRWGPLCPTTFAERTAAGRLSAEA